MTQLARPSLCLSEVMKQEELERLIMLICSVEYSSGNSVWGGVWAGHAIMCLLQDILEGLLFISIVFEIVKLLLFFSNEELKNYLEETLSFNLYLKVDKITCCNLSISQ